MVGPVPLTRISRAVFSDDDEESLRSHETWMRHHSVVRNRTPDYKSWKATYGKCERALRDLGNLLRVPYRAEGNFTPKDMRGAQEVEPGPLLFRFEQWLLE